MDNDKGRPEWALYMDRGDVAGLCVMITAPGFDFQQSASLQSLGFGTSPYYRDDRLTPIGYALWRHMFWAFELLLEAGANPDAEHISWHKGKSGTMHYRPIELCATKVQPREFLDCLLEHGASTHFVKRSTKTPFNQHVIEHMSMFRRNSDRTHIILAAHDRELRAYTAVWCALNAGGSWPDMAMLLQAMVMRDELICEVSTPLSKRREK